MRYLKHFCSEKHASIRVIVVTTALKTYREYAPQEVPLRDDLDGRLIRWELKRQQGQVLPLAYLTLSCNHSAMSRPLRIEFPGAVYHVTSRGDRREAIFDDDQDRHAFLSVIAQATERFDAAILAYCLMDNHYHLVIHTRRGNLSRFMQQLNGVYTQIYNRRHSKVGHLFQGRFKGILVDESAYLLEVCRYVDLNPVRARMVRDPANWRWSSYNAHIGAHIDAHIDAQTGKSISPAWLDTPAVHGYLLGRDAATPADRRRAGSRYAALVAAGKGAKLWDEALTQQIYLGDAGFIERMQALMEKDSSSAKDIPRAQRATQAKPIDYYLKRNKDRDAGIRDAVTKGQHSMTDVGKVLGLTVSRISRIVKAGTNYVGKEARGKA